MLLTCEVLLVGYRAADPGFAKTNIMRELPSYIASMVFLGFRVLGLLQSPDEGAESLVDAALAPPVKTNLL